MKKKRYSTIVLVSLTLIVISATLFAAKATTEIALTPTSGEPDSNAVVRGSVEMTGEFKPQSTVGIGFGAEVEVTNEAVTVTATGTNTAEGYTANKPIKPGSFKWSAPYGALTVEVFDLGNGTLGDYFGWLSSGIINYTSGYFSRNVQMGLNFDVTNNKVNYTTYEHDITPAAGVQVTSSGSFIATITVPQVANGSYTITAIDEVGTAGIGSFQVIGSDIIPEPLTLGTIVLLSSTAVMVSFYWLRKRHYTKNIV